MSDRKRPTNIGGQAVIEGVMMRGKKIYAMAVRNPEGEIVVEKKPVGGLGKKGLFRYPISRGMAAFVDSLVTGTKILMRFRIPRRNEHSSICYVFVRDRRNIGGMDT